MLRRVHRCLGAAWVENYNFGLVSISQDSLPHDRMGDAEIGADEDEHVRLLEIRVGERRRIEAKALLVGHVRSSHALARVRIAVNATHAELEQSAQQRHLFSANLSGAEKGDA